MRDENDDYGSEKDVKILLDKYELMLKQNEQYFFDVYEFEELINCYIDEKRNITKALQVCILAIGQHPYSVVFLIRQAQLYGSLNNIHKAMESISKAELMEPSRSTC